MMGFFTGLTLGLFLGLIGAAVFGASKRDKYEEAIFEAGKRVGRRENES